MAEYKMSKINQHIPLYAVIKEKDNTILLRTMNRKIATDITLFLNENIILRRLLKLSEIFIKDKMCKNHPDNCNCRNTKCNFFDMPTHSQIKTLIESFTEIK